MSGKRNKSTRMRRSKLRTTTSDPDIESFNDRVTKDAQEENGYEFLQITNWRPFPFWAIKRIAALAMQLRPIMRVK